jgi:hypothetical protein
MDDGFQMNPLAGEERETLAQIETELTAEEAERARARAVTLENAMLADLVEEFEVRLHGGLKVVVVTE